LILDSNRNFIYEYVNFRWLKEINDLQTIYASKTKAISDLLQKKNLRSFGIRFTHNTNKIEGSTLSKGDTRTILEDGIIPANSNANDVIETKAHMLPFEDGNGRITRLFTNYILYWEDFPLYDLDVKYKKGYYNALERSNMKENEIYFISWFFPRYITYIKKTMISLGYLT